MKARVIETGEIVEITKIEDNLFIDNHYCPYEPYEIEWEINDNDYWTRLEHQAAIAAMGGMCGYAKYVIKGKNSDLEGITKLTKKLFPKASRRLLKF